MSFLHTKYAILGLLGVFAAFACRADPEKSSSSKTSSGTGTALVNTLTYYNSYPFNHVYTLKINVGGQDMETVLDTGSSNLLLIGDSNYCKNCVNEYGYDSVYTPSSTSNALSTSWSMSFLPIGSASIRGYQDTVVFQGLNLGTYDFGLVISEKGIPNILGIAYPLVAQPSSNRQTPVFETLIEKFDLKNQFSLTLCALKTGSSLTLGGYDSNLGASDLEAVKWAPIIEKRWYTIPVVSIYVQNSTTSTTEWSWKPESTDILLVDSGTTPMVFPGVQVSALVTVLKSYANANGISIPASFWPTSTDKGGLTTLTDAQIAMFPYIKFDITSFEDSSKTFTINVAPQTYFQTTSKGLRLLGIQPGSGLYILGTVLMENYVVLHDRGTSDTIDATAKLGFFPNTNFCK